MLLGISACSGSNSAGNDGSGSGTSAQQFNGVAGADSSGLAATPDKGLTIVSAAELDRQQIKTAAIALRSSQIETVVTRVEGVAASQGGFVDSENTQTSPSGVATSSFLTIKVPVAAFDTSVQAVTHLGQLASEKVSTQDVTGRVADVNSRVTSAQDAIAQLRLLFSHATKLSDIITLESELTQRESDLEALQAQQRVLTAQTTLSTISVQITPPTHAAPSTVSHSSTSGFFGGLRQGWDALVTTFESVSHALGAALPLGVVLLALGALGWFTYRRIPRHRVETSE